MDTESLVQIERIVTAAIGATESRLRQESQSLALSLRKEISEQSAKLGERIEEVRRYSGVLHEDVLHKIDLLAEGHQSLDQKIDRLDAKMEHEFVETRAVVQLSYRQLHERVETLEQRVHVIEKRLGISA